MQEIVARTFIVLLIVFYSSVAMAFIVMGIRNWVWRPLARKFTPQRQSGSYRRIDSPSHEQSQS